MAKHQCSHFGSLAIFANWLLTWKERKKDYTGTTCVHFHHRSGSGMGRGPYLSKWGKTGTNLHAREQDNIPTHTPPS